MRPSIAFVLTWGLDGDRVGLGPVVLELNGKQEAVAGAREMMRTKRRELGWQKASHPGLKRCGDAVEFFIEAVLGN